MASKGFNWELLLRRALITPSCGAGGVVTEPLAERVLSLLRQLCTQLRRTTWLWGQPAVTPGNGLTERLPTGDGGRSDGLFVGWSLGVEVKEGD